MDFRQVRGTGIVDRPVWGMLLGGVDGETEEEAGVDVCEGVGLAGGGCVGEDDSGSLCSHGSGKYAEGPRSAGFAQIVSEGDDVKDRLAERRLPVVAEVFGNHRRRRCVRKCC